VNAGAHYVALDFIAIEPAGGDLRAMADQVRRGIAWVYKNAASFGGDPERLYIGGHSSGGPLFGGSFVTDLQEGYRLPPDLPQRRALYEWHVRREARAPFQAKLLHQIR